MIRRADNSRDQVVLKQHLQEARYFLNSLEARNETLLRVAQSIVEEQRAFLDYGPEAMRPMVLRDIAEQLVIHESTVSRATATQYMPTPPGDRTSVVYGQRGSGRVEHGIARAKTTKTNNIYYETHK